MLHKLDIENIILIKSASLSFERGLHIFSGETGAGKTAILQALHLVLGSRLDTALIRKGESAGRIRAHFIISSNFSIYEILKPHLGSINLKKGLILEREIRSDGKGRVTINGKSAPLSLLRKLAPHLVEIVSQHGTQSLMGLDAHRDHLDRFARHLDLADRVKTSFYELAELKGALKKLENTQREHKRLESRWACDLDEIEGAKILSEREEEEVFEAFQVAMSAKERRDLLSLINLSVQEEDPCIIGELKAHLSSLSKFSDSSFNRLKESLLSVIEELTEFSYSAMKVRDQIEEDPALQNTLEERLGVLNHLKKRYGPTLKDVLQTQKELKQKLGSFKDLSKEIAATEKQIKKVESSYLKDAKLLSQKRKSAANKLSMDSKKYFKELNLPNAELIIDLEETPPTENGLESVEFFLMANVGEKRSSLKEHVSGGELSRVLLTLKVLMAEFEDVPTLIFDEIDANLGGETAPKIGQLLKVVSKSKQVLAITHLPQVAIYGKYHYLIEKREEKGRTYSLVERLSEKQKVLEIERMLGGKKLSQKAGDLAKDLLKTTDL